jgi:hypothetical protein
VVFSRDVVRDCRTVVFEVVKFRRVVNVFSCLVADVVATVFSCLVAQWCRGCRTFVFEVVKLRRVGGVSSCRISKNGLAAYYHYYR